MNLEASPAAIQPDEGETFLWCNHHGNRDFHWFLYDPPLEVSVNARELGKVRFLAVCDTCLKSHPVDPLEVATARRVWNHDSPIREGRDPRENTERVTVRQLAQSGAVIEC